MSDKASYVDLSGPGTRPGTRRPFHIARFQPPFLRPRSMVRAHQRATGYQRDGHTAATAWPPKRSKSVTNSVSSQQLKRF
jgi:hypothetical protein